MHELIFQAFNLYLALYAKHTIPGTALFRSDRAQRTTYRALDRYGRRLQAYARTPQTDR